MPLPHRLPAQILSKRRARSVRTSRPLTLESLEARQLLAAHTLESVTGTIPAGVNATSSARLTLDSTGPAVLLGLRVVSTDSSTGFDPAAPLVRRSDQSIAAVESWQDVSATDSTGMTLVEFQRGLTYDILISAEGATGGAYRLEVFLPGDLDGNGQVDTSEMQQATGAIVADQFGGNFVSSQAFRKSNKGNATPTAVREALDLDQNGRVDIDEFAIVERQLGMPPLILDLIQDGDAPAITLQRVNGPNDRNPTDTVTNQTRITGTLSDISTIQSFEASIDNGPFVSLLGPGFFPAQDFRTNPNFELNLSQLQTIAGTGASPLANTGEHILRVRAADQTGNTVRDPIELRFQFDTLAPAAPPAPTLAANTPGNGSNIRTITPTIIVSAETASRVELFSGTTLIGSGDVGAGGSVEIVTSALTAGSNSITAQAIDAAGNTSSSSAALAITVDITAPPVSNLTLSPPTSLQDPEGHPLVGQTTVSLNGTTEPEATVQLTVGTTIFGTQVANATGSFTFASVPLAFGKNLLTQQITDAAGNTSNNNNTAQTITRDSDPTVAAAMGQRTVDEDSGVFSIALSSVFADADLASGDVLTFIVQSNSSTSLATAVLDGSNLRVTPLSNQHGSATIVVRATDTFGRFVQDTLSLTVTSVPDPPVAGSDTVNAPITQGEQTLTAQLLSNDSDPDGGQLTIISVNTSSTLGVVTLENGVVKYNPLPHFDDLGPTETAQDSFTYTVQDAEGATATATVNITVRGNDPPIAQDDDFATNADTNRDGNVFEDNGHGADADPDATTTQLTVTNPGTRATSRGGSVTINADGSFSYNPTGSAELRAVVVGQSLVDTFEYTVSDGMASDTATVRITVAGTNIAPTLAEIQNVTLLAGAPLHIPLDGFDAESHTLTFTATSSDPSLVQTILSPNTNRSMRVDVTNFGTMVFHLFEDLVPRVTSNIIGIANAGTYDGVIFHRIVKADAQGNPFVIQGGDPNGNGQNDENAPEFDDQFHVDLPHTSTGLLSMAKGGDDSNSSQFFITAPTTPTLRRLDFNHSVFGQLVEGESVRQAIQQVPTGDQDRPTTPVVMQNVEIILDQENGVLRLKAAEGASGQATITVTARDARGAEVTRTFQVTVQPDTFNGVPFLNDIPAVSTTQDTAVSFEVSAQDAENSTVTFAHAAQGGTPLNGTNNPNLAFTVARDDSFGDAFTTRFTVTPPTGFVGTLDLLVGVSSTGSDTVDTFDRQLVTITVNPTPAPLTLAPGSQSDAGLGSDGLAPTEVIASDDARLPAVLASAVSTWQEQLGTNLDLDIQVQVGQHAGDQLADATILDYDAAGRPSVGLITLDDDALGIGWHVDVNSQPTAGDLDLYTTLLHEVGHLLGFTAYYAPFAQLLTQSEGNTVFAADGVWAQLDDDGLHLDHQLHPNDLMNATLAPGQRRLPSALDVSILNAVYRALESSQIAAADELDGVSAIDQVDGLDALDEWFALLPTA